ncbi:MAG: F0F1 ATP synthase subunit epsilon [Flavobacterium sp.]|jgi:F-type H+-transporting ATPase subunit epsilon|nr:F0F1 ATP synthase subunit epsilon [Flavobacterium sp.]
MLLEIVSPEAKLFSGEITSLSLPGVDGDFQILNNHAPIVSLLKKGTVKIAAPSFNISKETVEKFTKVNDQLYTLSVDSGTIEMKDNKIILLAD